MATTLGLAAFFEPERNIAAGFFVDLSAGLRTYIAPWAAEEPPKVAVIGLDHVSLATPPFRDAPRVLFGPYWAQIAQTALDNGARVVIFDIIFNFDTFEEGNEPLEQALFAVVRGSNAPLVDLAKGHRGIRDQPDRLIIATSADLEPIIGLRRLLSRGNGVGYAELPRDADNIIRHVPFALETAERGPVPTLVAQAQRRFSEAEPRAIELIPPFDVGSLPSVSAASVYRCAGDNAPLKSLFQDKAVFVGGVLRVEDQLSTADRFIPRAKGPSLSALATEDCPLERPVDMGRPGVFIHAAALDGALRGWAPSRVGEGDVVAAIITALTAGVAAALALYLNQLPATVITSLALPSLLLIANAISLDFGRIFAFSAPYFAIPIAFLSGLSVRVWVIDRARLLLRRQFGKYLSDEVIDAMTQQGVEPQLGGAVHEATLLFADISNFTDYSDAATRKANATQDAQEKAAQEVMMVINDYLSLLAETVANHHGYVDKFMGDAVMAIWNTPRQDEDHAANAVRCAMDMVDSFNRTVAADPRLRGMRADKQLRLKVGVEMGVAMVGNVGSPERLSFTAMGPDVNVASRLESACKQLGVELLIGPRIAERLERYGGQRLLRLGPVVLKGVAEAKDLYVPESRYAQKARLEHEAALAIFKTGDYREAAVRWERMKQEDVPWAGVFAKLANRLEEGTDLPELRFDSK